MVGILASGLSCARYDSQRSFKIFLTVAKVNQRHWEEESGQWLENVDRSHLAPGQWQVSNKKILAQTTKTDLVDNGAATDL